MTNRITRRLALIEHDRAQAAVDAARDHNRMMRQLQTEFGLPLPDGTPDDVYKEGVHRAIAMQAALRERPSDHSPAYAFRAWVQSVHKQYGDAK